MGNAYGEESGPWEDKNLISAEKSWRCLIAMWSCEAERDDSAVARMDQTYGAEVEGVVCHVVAIIVRNREDEKI